MTAQIGAPMWLDLQSVYANLRRWVEQIVHIDEVTGSSFVATARKARLIACTLRTDTENRPCDFRTDTENRPCDFLLQE